MNRAAANATMHVQIYGERFLPLLLEIASHTKDPLTQYMATRATFATIFEQQLWVRMLGLCAAAASVRERAATELGESPRKMLAEVMDAEVGFRQLCGAGPFKEQVQQLRAWAREQLRANERRAGEPLGENMALATILNQVAEEAAKAIKMVENVKRIVEQANQRGIDPPSSCNKALRDLSRSARLMQLNVADLHTDLVQLVGRMKAGDPAAGAPEED